MEAAMARIPGSRAGISAADPAEVTAPASSPTEGSACLELSLETGEEGRYVHRRLTECSVPYRICRFKWGSVGGRGVGSARKGKAGLLGGCESAVML